MKALRFIIISLLTAGLLLAVNPVNQLGRGTTSLALSGSDTAVGDPLYGFSPLNIEENKLIFNYSLGLSACSNGLVFAPVSLAAQYRLPKFSLSAGNQQSVIPGIYEGSILVNKIFVSMGSSLGGLNWLVRGNLYLASYRQLEQTRGTRPGFDVGMGWGDDFRMAFYYELGGPIDWKKNGDMILYTAFPQRFNIGLSYDHHIKSDTLRFLFNYRFIFVTSRDIGGQVINPVLYKDEHDFSLGTAYTRSTERLDLSLMGGLEFSEEAEIFQLVGGQREIGLSLGSEIDVKAAGFKVSLGWARRLLYARDHRVSLGLTYYRKDDEK